MKKIITEKYAIKLVKEGKASHNNCGMVTYNNRQYQSIINHKNQNVQHYEI
jgi:hypothetical protein